MDQYVTIIRTIDPPTWRRLLAAVFAAAVAAYCASTAGHCAPPPSSPPARVQAAPAPLAGAPFDAAAVRRLIAGIDRAENARALKYQYFLVKTPQPLSRTDGLVLVKSAFGTSEPGTRRWFSLASVVGFAGLQLTWETQYDGYHAYAALLARSNDAERAGAEDVLETAVSELVTALGETRVQREPDFQGDGQSLAVTAASVYLRMVAAGRWHGATPPWSPVTKSVLDPSDVGDVVTKMLAEPGVAQTYDLLRAAAVIYQYTDPDKAIVYFGRAMALLPAGKPEEAAWLYRSYANVLWENGLAEDAASVQQELVSQTGRGKGKLAILCLCAADIPRGRRILHELEEPTSEERDVSEAADLLFALDAERPGAGVGYGTLASNLLKAYLGARRVRSYPAEMQSRLALAGYLASHGDRAQALSVIAEKQLPAPPNHSDSAKYHGAIERLRATIGEPVGPDAKPGS